MFTIRAAKQEDASFCAVLFNEIDESGFMLFEPGERHMNEAQALKMIARFSSDERSTFLVAEVDGKLTGYIVAIGNELVRNQHRAYIVIGVLPAYQTQGIASQFFEALFEWAKQLGIWRLELTVIVSNEKAISLYKKLGFEIEGERQASLIVDGKPVSEYYMYVLLT